MDDQTPAAQSWEQLNRLTRTLGGMRMARSSPWPDCCGCASSSRTRRPPGWRAPARVPAPSGSAKPPPAANWPPLMTPSPARPRCAPWRPPGPPAQHARGPAKPHPPGRADEAKARPSSSLPARGPWGWKNCKPGTRPRSIARTCAPNNRPWMSAWRRTRGRRGRQSGRGLPRGSSEGRGPRRGVPHPTSG